MKNLKKITCPWFFAIIFLISTLTMGSFVFEDQLEARSFEKTGAPPELAPWVPWVLYDQLNKLCPKNPTSSSPECVWPIKLKIEVDRAGGTFEGLWEVRADSWIRLPGQIGAWPIEVTDEFSELSSGQDGAFGLGPRYALGQEGLVFQAPRSDQSVSTDLTSESVAIKPSGPAGPPDLNGSAPQPIAVTGNYPMVKLSPGRHLIKGHFSWKVQPKTLTLPLGPILDLTVSGTKKFFPVLDDQNSAGTTNLWLDDKPVGLNDHSGLEDSENSPSASEQNNLRVQIDRLLVDTQPMTVITRVRLTVSGAFREEMIKQVLLPDTTPTVLTSPVPARLSSEGLQIQLSPGVHDIFIQGRINLDIESLGPVGSLYGSETWTFIQQPTLRQVEIDGAGQVDPTLVDLPWGSSYPWNLIRDDQGRRMALSLNSLPIYQLEPGDSLRFTVLRRGDPEPGPDILELTRACWLDFDGLGLTCRDDLNVNMRRSSYLAVKPPFELGQVSLNGVPQVISWQIDSQGEKIPGLQLRQGQVKLKADLRLEPFDGLLPASGWDQSLHSQELLFHYPPGYNLFYVDGAKVSDEHGYPTSWWDRWSNLDLFIVLAITIAMFKLFGPFWALLAAVTLGLSYHEFMSPRLVFLHVLGATALLSVLPASGKARFTVRSWRFISSIFLIVVSIAFVINQARVAIYPQLYPVYASKGSWVYPITNRLSPGQGLGTDHYGQEATSSDYDGDYEDYDKPPVPMAMDLSKPQPLYEAESMDMGSSIGLESSLAADRAPSTQSSQRSGSQALRQTKPGPQKQNSLIMVAPEAKVQNTLPRPNWDFRYLYLDFNSQVSKDQTVKLLFMGPKLSRLICFLRILLMSYLVLAIICSRGALKFGGFLGKIMPKPWLAKAQDPKSHGPKNQNSPDPADQSQAVPGQVAPDQAAPAQTLPSADSNKPDLSLSELKNGLTKAAVVLALVGAMLLMSALGLAFSKTARADTEKWSAYPPQEILLELQRRLLTDDHDPRIGLTSLTMSVPQKGYLRISLLIQAQNEVMVALPNLDPMVFQPTAVVLADGESLPLMTSNEGSRYVLLPKGIQTVDFEGRLAEIENFQLTFNSNFLPQRVELMDLPNWFFTGLDQNDHPQGNSINVFTDFKPEKPEDLSENKDQASPSPDQGGAPGQSPSAAESGQSSQSDASEPGSSSGQGGSFSSGPDGFQGALKPFFMVERTLSLGIEWKIYTTVSAFDPILSPYTLNLPLLAGEKPTTMGLTIKDGQATLSFNPGVRQISWESDLDINLEKPIELTAQSGPYTESWTLDAASFWRVESSGLTPIYNLAPSGYWNPKWRPWANESVKIAVSRPEPVPGRFLVVDGANLEVSLGEENRHNQLTLSLRSSFGGPFAFDLPAGSEIQTLTMDNQNLPSSSMSGPKVVLPLTPGDHSVMVSWLETKSISTISTSPALNLDLAAANITVNIKTPQDRWTLFARGPVQGPAVLFWSMAGAILIISLFLGRVKITPLGTVSWFLLFLGLAQLHIFFGLLVAGWLLVFGLRGTRDRIKKNSSFNLTQIGLVIWTILALLAIYNGLRHGLLEAPVMAVTGYHNSSDHNLYWFVDRASGAWPEASVITIPDRYYSYFMLAWALWLAISLIRWMKWLWNSFSYQGFWAVSKSLPKFPNPYAPNSPPQNFPPGPFSPSPGPPPQNFQGLQGPPATPPPPDLSQLGPQNNPPGEPQNGPKDPQDPEPKKD